MDEPLKAAILDDDWIMFEGLLAYADLDALSMAIQTGRFQMVERILQQLVCTSQNGLCLLPDLDRAIDQWHRHDQADVLIIVELLLHYTVPMDVRTLLARVGELDIVPLFQLLYAYDRDNPPRSELATVSVGPGCLKFLYDQQDVSADYLRHSPDRDDDLDSM